jgi:DNA-binding MarR family transcriptional regulator
MPEPPETDEALITRAVLRLGRRLRAARPPGAIGFAALAMLTTIARLGPVPAARLAAEERLQPQSLTRMLEALERDGLIERRPGTADRRTRLVAISDAGRAALAYDLEARRRWLERAMAATLTPGERQRLKEAAALMLRLADSPAAARAAA